jgi:hypothetical protein
MAGYVRAKHAAADKPAALRCPTDGIWKEPGKHHKPDRIRQVNDGAGNPRDNRNRKGTDPKLFQEEKINLEGYND